MLLFLRKCVAVSHPLRRLLWEMPRHGRGEAHAKFQLKRLAEPNVLDDLNFDMLGENFGYDRG